MPVRTGAEYLAGLRDGRELWYAGERVADVTAHPLLSRTARTLAALYDLQAQPQSRDALTYPSPDTGAPTGLSFLQPRRPAELVQRRAMFKLWADQSGGLLGRTPDYLNAILSGCAMARDHFARNGPEYGERIVAYHAWCREHDRCATHSLGTPQTDRSRNPTDQRDLSIALHIVGESSAGLVVSGARNLATLAPYADELLILPSPSRTQPLHPELYAFAFAIPVATPGLRFICRESYDLGRPAVDHPLASRFEEMDCVAVFHAVVVPWERVFLKGDPGLCDALFRATPAFLGGMHQAATRAWAKAEFVFGVAALLAETLGRTELPAYQQMLGELVDVVETLRAFVRAAEADAWQDAHGYWHPAREPLYAARTYFPCVAPRLTEIVQLIGSSGLMATPTAADLAQPALAADIAKYYQSATLGGHERVRLFRLAWDLACSSFGGRQVLYERFFAGDPATLQATRFLSYDRSAAVARVRALLEAADVASISDALPAAR